MLPTRRVSARQQSQDAGSEDSRDAAAGGGGRRRAQLPQMRLHHLRPAQDLQGRAHLRRVRVL